MFNFSLFFQITPGPGVVKMGGKDVTVAYKMLDHEKADEILGIDRVVHGDLHFSRGDIFEICFFQFHCMKILHLVMSFFRSFGFEGSWRPGQAKECDHVRVFISFLFIGSSGCGYKCNGIGL